MTASKNNIMIMAGGTGGHVYPALAVAQELQQRGCNIMWLGTKTGIEARIVPAHHIPLFYLSIAGVRGKHLKALITFPWKLGCAMLEAYRIFKREHPSAVLGMGGYASGPGALVAFLMNIPIVIHEQNAIAGTTNKWLAKIASKTLTAFPKVLPNALWVGNPVRLQITSVAAPEIRFAQRKPGLRLLILGGSLGAKALNEMVPQALAELNDLNIEVMHQAGRQHLQVTKILYEQFKVAAQVIDFIDDMAQSLAWADLVICRSGALTVAELSAVGVAAILVPFPYAIDDHQTANAQWLVNLGGAKLFHQKDLTASQLSQILLTLYQNPEHLLSMAIAARSGAQTDAVRRCADICLEVAHG